MEWKHMQQLLYLFLFYTFSVFLDKKIFSMILFIVKKSNYAIAT